MKAWIMALLDYVLFIILCCHGKLSVCFKLLWFFSCYVAMQHRSHSANSQTIWTQRNFCQTISKITLFGSIVRQYKPMLESCLAMMDSPYRLQPSRIARQSDNGGLLEPLFQGSFYFKAPFISLSDNNHVNLMFTRDVFYHYTSYINCVNLKSYLSRHPS